MHFFMSLMFSLLAVGLTLVYIVAFLFVAVLGRYLICLLFSLVRKTPKPELFPERGVKFVKRFGGYALCFFLVVQVFLYVGLRYEWMGEDNANLDAKEYFVAGMMVSAPLKLLTVSCHPENIIVRPFWNLLEGIYDKGSKLLPADDGEKAVWRQMWFLQRYVKKDRRTKDGHRRRYSPDMVNLLDDIWSSLELMATKNYADKAIRVQHLKNFSGLATYYTLHDGEYLENTAGSGPIMAKDPVHVARSRNLIQWLQELELKWQEDSEVLAMIKKRPSIQVSRQLAIIGSLYRIIDAEIFSREFNCDSAATLLYVKIMEEFVGSKEHPSPLKQLSVKRRERLYDAYVGNVIAHFHQIMFNEYCGYDVAGQEQRELLRNFDWEKKVHSLYKEEYRILEEIFHVR